jgi:hypothetical protein
MTDLFKLILGVLASLFMSRAKLEAEILILRQQINVLRRRASRRPHLNNAADVPEWSFSADPGRRRQGRFTLVFP